MGKLDRAFQVSDGLAHLAGKKIKAAVDELQKEGIITKAEAQKIVGQMTKVKRSIYDTVSRELKKVATKAVSRLPKRPKSSKKRQ